jgi:two-component system response regulator FlrC
MLKTKGLRDVARETQRTWVAPAAAGLKLPLVLADIRIRRMSAEPQSCFLGVAAIIVSPEMRHIMELVQRVARTSASVLITGETGCGKEIVARAIHHYSLRCCKP